jgi:hypothetical protein
MSAVAPSVNAAPSSWPFPSETPVVSAPTSARSFDAFKFRSQELLMVDLADVLQNSEVAPMAVDLAAEWLPNILDLCMKLGGWSRPHMSSTADGEVVLEWWKGTRKLTVYFSDTGAEYIKVWGPDMDSEMTSGELNHWSFISAWSWLRS